MKCTPADLRSRQVSKCRRSCCKNTLVKKAPEYIPIFNNARHCSMCKRKFYAHGVQCMLGHFNCVPNE